MTKIRLGDKAIRDPATANQGKVHLGDDAPVFAPAAICAGDKAVRDAATANQGKVHLGDDAPVFAPKK
jgi:hypothetical protein